MTSKKRSHRQTRSKGSRDQLPKGQRISAATNPAVPTVSAELEQRPPGAAASRHAVRGRPWQSSPYLRRLQDNLALERLLGADGTLWIACLLVIPIIVAGFILTVGLRVQGLPGIDNDYWWHLGTGNWILDNHRIPTTDPFSWTYLGEEWVAHEWLAEVILAVLARIGGYAATIVFTAILIVAGFWWLMAGVRAYGLSWRMALLVTLLWGGAFTRASVLVVRPQVWTFALLTLVLAELAMYDTGRRRHLWLLPPIFVVWTNLNLTVLIGLMCLGAFGLDRLLRRRLDRHLVIVGILCGLALLVNPTGPGLIEAALKYRGQNEIWHQFIFEWMSPDLQDRTHLPFVLALPLIPIAAWQLLVRRRVWPAAPLLVLAYQSYGAVRFIPVFAILAIYFAGWLMWRLTEDQKPQERVSLPVLPRQKWLYALPILAVVLVGTVAVASDKSTFQREAVTWAYPEVATTMLLEKYPDARLFNVYDYGGYLIYRFEDHPKFPKVYIDGRGEMYSNEFLRNYFDLIYGLPGWQEKFNEIGITAALVRHIDGLSVQLEATPGWEAIYSDAYSVLYVRYQTSSISGDQASRVLDSNPA